MKVSHDPDPEFLPSGQSESGPEIKVSLDGPYRISNVLELRNWLVEELPLQSEMALCRCGQPSNKLHCNGSHARANFSGAKDPKRVPDKRDAYEGQQAEIFDIAGSVLIRDSELTG